MTLPIKSQLEFPKMPTIKCILLSIPFPSHTRSSRLSLESLYTRLFSVGVSFALVPMKELVLHGTLSEFL